MTTDIAFPALHRVHPRGWLNDPNGILRSADGRWHVYFQFNPHSARHERIHWGHMSSPDMVTWRQEPLGPVPRPGEADQDGCWSGVGLMDGDTPTLVYSGVDGANNQFSRVIVARTDPSAAELIDPGRVVAEIPEVEGLIGVRDPFLFEHDGRRWAVQGAGVREGGGFVATLLLYDAEDLEDWRLVGTLLHGDDPVAQEHAPADLWECPQLVKVGERWVLLLSLWRHRENGDEGPVQVNHLVGDLVTTDDGTPRFIPSGGGRAELGPDFYAPQAVADNGRALLWGWAWEEAERTQEQTDAQGWAGTLTSPRVLRLRGDTLLMDPAPELAVLRGDSLEPSETGLQIPAPFRAEVRVTGPAHVVLRRADGEEQELLAAQGPATILLDGGLLEVLEQESTAATRRFHPRSGDIVLVRGQVDAAWELRRP
ncbi:glycoside hydrolase family 32 protein [Brachybacterium sp. UMB0905]|uniref:glycoside hydrolase family 32 protein n=1 Tax=Brachybacterium sp. UMB0905 TaxID=2069310 RepID=UPI000C8061EF|nr:glycoside hydrolase family 32 protein [Brachybacterium sp. UMB0905]PMC76155.1 glycoside hydrolase [Brachybacterium sp. UMB0905]